MTRPTIAEVNEAVRSVLGREGAIPPFAGKLLGLKHLEDLPEGIGEVRIGPGTVVTPLAHDFLKRRGIAIRWVSREEVGGSLERGSWGFAIDHESGLASALRRGLLGEGGWIEIGTSPVELARWVIASEERGGVLLTAEASIAVWEAYQVPGIRAAVVGDANAVTRAVRNLGTNLLVIEPLGLSIPWVKHLVNTYRRAGAPRPPAWMWRGPDPGPADYEDRRSHRSSDALAVPSQPARGAVHPHLAPAPGSLDGRFPEARRGRDRV
jgi:hypothetical protein